MPLCASRVALGVATPTSFASASSNKDQQSQIVSLQQVEEAEENSAVDHLANWQVVAGSDLVALSPS